MITPTTPVTIPAVSAKTADALWISNLTINAPNLTDKVNATAMVVPYNSSTGELLRGQAKMLRLNDLFGMAATNANIANAMQALFLAVQEQIQIQKLF